MAIGSVKQFILVATMSTEFVCVAQAQDWDITGNAGTSPPQNFLGTTDSAALELKVNSQRALRIEPRASPNLIGGYAGNAADSAATGATIGGGGNDGAENRVVGSYGTVAGGLGNTAAGRYAGIGGGQANEARGAWSTVAGGWRNTAAGDYSFAAGRQAKANHIGSFVWSDSGSLPDFPSTANNQFLIRASGGVGIGTNSPNEELVVDGGNAAARVAIDSDSPTANAGVSLRQDGTPRWAVATVGNRGDFRIYEDDAGATRLSIKGDGQGKVGIGTVEPEALFHVNGGPNNEWGMILSSGGGSAYGLKISTAWFGHAHIPLLQANALDGAAEIPRFTVQANGDVGIGTPDPNATLNVQGDAILFQSASGSGRSVVTTAGGGSSGAMATFGANGNLNTAMVDLADDPNLGAVAVYDADGNEQAYMLVDLDGRGFVVGDVKSFRVPNPNQPDTDIVYAAIEGPEAAAYVRGTGQLVRGAATIDLPQHFVSIASTRGMTVQLTPNSARSLGLAVEQKSTERTVVRELMNGKGSYEFDWEVKSIRKGYEDYRVIRPTEELALRRVDWEPSEQIR
jgi:hypothetical protein